LGRVLDALSRQVLPKDNWELILIDNASEYILSQRWDLSWHPRARHVREDELGLTAARVRGIAEAAGEILVFVDDDNLLRHDYLEEALRIAREWPVLGVWGGTITAEFETEPEHWLRPIIGYLAVREWEGAIWSNNKEDWHAQPYGAGMCVRATVAAKYLQLVSDNPLRRLLGRSGNAQMSCEDLDIAQTACDLGLGFGNFPQLRLTHLISGNRVRPDYMLSVLRGTTASAIVLRFLRSGILPVRRAIVITILKYVLVLMTEGRGAARIYKASLEGIRLGADYVGRIKNGQLAGS
jgi:glycosyltransferase involved in cell wall biosynthesis